MITRMIVFQYFEEKINSNLITRNVLPSFLYFGLIVQKPQLTKDSEVTVIFMRVKSEIKERRKC